MITNAGLKKWIGKSGIAGTAGIMCTVLFTASGFYYQTTIADATQTRAIEAVQKDVVEIKATINNTEVFKGVSTAEYGALKDKVAGIEKTVDKIDSKLDKILIQTK